MNETFLSAYTKSGRMRQTVLDLWQRHVAEGTIPTNNRFLYYELLGMQVISKVTAERTDGKKGRRTDQDLIDALTDLREAGLIPWEDIVDETRDLTQWRVHATLAEAMHSAFMHARLNIWHPDPAPLILCESRSLRGVLEPTLAREYLAPITSTNGQCNAFLRTQVAPNLVAGQIVLYLGDLDFSGNHIEANARRVLEESRRAELAWERVAITQKQVEKNNLQPIQKYDKRTKTTHAAVETEALGQSLILELLRTRLRQLMPTRRREAVQEREDAERTLLGQKLCYIAKDKRKRGTH